MAKRRILILLLMSSLCGCGAEVDRGADHPTQFAPWTDTARPYRFRPGDELDVHLLYNPELSDRVRVGPDGRVGLALLGSVLAEGRSAEELTTDLLARYKGELRRPDVVVIGRQFEGQRVYVGGEVRSPGAIVVPGRLGVLEAVIAAGGLKETARTAQVVLVRRNAENQPMLRTVDLDALTRAGAADQDVPLLAGDIVLVPRSPIAKVDLFVDQYIRQALPFDRGVTYGFTQGGALIH